MAKRFRPRKSATLITLLAAALLAGLGTWQVQRLHWKTGLLRTMEERMARPPVPLPAAIDDPAAWDYRRVTMAGTFLHDHEFLVGPRTLDGANGYHLVTPFRRASGGVVFVNRGWIAPGLVESAQRPQGMVQVEGVAQAPVKSRFTPDNAPGAAQWYWIDIPAMARAAGLAGAAPVVVHVAAREEGAYPAGGQVRVHLRNDHLEYAVFWFSMIGVLLAVYVLSGLREEKEDGAGNV